MLKFLRSDSDHYRDTIVKMLYSEWHNMTQEQKHDLAQVCPSLYFLTLTLVCDEAEKSGRRPPPNPIPAVPQRHVGG